ncbi:copper chaperone PCu(A)C [Streptomyces sp. NPDC006512]|uniref:copper chaperone PCu(A)C n=1 Tax=Streptomyces sp. NPDC006512 TaxID=3154307 RepID=UPI0033AD69C3
MTGSPAPTTTGATAAAPTATTADGWRAGRGRLRDGVTAALVPALACLAALVGLTAWTTTGAAGSPPRIEPGVAHLLLPAAADGGRTTAFFRITNTGGADDQLVSVTSPVAEDLVLNRHVRAGGGAGTTRTVPSVTVPAGRTVTMTPNSVDVLMTVKGRLREGDTVPFVLRFRRSGPVDAVAFVVRPGS